MRDLDIPCKDIRTREVGMKQIQEAVSPDDVELIRRDYVANGGWETFLSYEDPEKDILIGELLFLILVAVRLHYESTLISIYSTCTIFEFRLTEITKGEPCSVPS